jgi:hypothetical protein
MSDPSSRDVVALRLLITDEKTGNPIAGVPVSVYATIAGPTIEPPPPSREARPPERAIPFPANLPQTRPLAALQTDGAGYVSFKFDRSATASASRLTAVYGVAPEGQQSFTIIDLLSGNDTAAVRLDASTMVGLPRTALPSVMAPDSRDLALSPASIGLIPQLATADLCRQLMPTTHGARRFRVVQIFADLCDPEVVSCSDRRVEVVRGKMCEYQIIWRPAGTSLGELLNTITLAPCEQVNIAISDWTREERSSRDETSEVRQVSVQDMNHDRLILETMDGVTYKAGESWGMAFGLSGPIEGVAASISGGAAGSASIQQIAAATSSKLSDRISQQATFVASRRASVVFQSTASEQHVYQTRTVRNHNHCHTLTLVYYQVNRSYNVITDYKGEREVLLVRADSLEFDAVRAYEHSGLLKGVLLDPTLANAFDQLADALFCCNLKPPDATPSVRMIDSLEMKFWLQRRDGSAWWFNGTFHYEGGSSFFGGSTTANLNPWQPGGMYTITVPISPPIDPASAVSVVLMLAGDPTKNSSLTFSRIEVTAHVVGTADSIPMYSTNTETTSEVNSPLLVWLEADATTGTTPSTTTNECVEKSCAIRKLLGHLNSHKRYYNTAVLFHQNPNDRVVQWSCCRKDGHPYDVIGQIENEPVTVYGDYVVFPVAGSKLADDPAVLPQSNVVLVRTGGVYSEGILGQCSTCEITDPGRFWNWKDSPCPDNAPAVVPPPDPKAGQGAGDLKAETITNLITLTGATEPSGVALKDLITSLVTNADSGSTVAKDVLTKLLESIKDSLAPKKT